MSNSSSPTPSSPSPTAPEQKPRRRRWLRILLPVILAASLLASLAACNAPTNQPDVPVATGTFVASYAMAAGDGTRVRIRGTTFHILQNQITWESNGSLKLQPNWGLLELRESPNAVDISLDGVVLTSVAK